MRWHELTPAQKKRRLVRWGDATELLQLGGDPPLEARAAPLRTLAGIALHEEAAVDEERVGSVAARIDEAVCDLRVLLEWVEREEAEGVGEAPYPPNFPKMPGEPKRVQPSRARPSED